MLVPVLVGMSHAGSDGVGLILDMSDGYSVNALVPNDTPRVLPKNPKGHFMVDIVEFLTDEWATALFHDRFI